MDERTNISNVKQLLKCERHLRVSPYGRKVLATMLKLKNERKINNGPKHNVNVPRQFGRQNERVLSYNTYETPKTCPIINDGANETRFYNITNQNNNNSIPVPSSNSLLQSPYDNIRGIPDIVCTSDVPYFDFNSQNIQQHTVVKESIAYEVVDNKSDDISWNNMFDADMFDCLDKPDYIDKRKETLNKENLLEVVDTIAKGKLEHMNNNTTMTEKATCKAKNGKSQNEKVKSNVSKKANDKVSYRKEKYTTTIKNWLDDVDAANTVNEECVESVQIPQNSNVKTNFNDEELKNHPLETTKIIKKENKNKRSIQAQLANKDGVMKYKKPKIHDSDGKSTENDLISNMDDAPAVVQPIEEPVAKIDNKKKKPNVIKPIKESTTKLVKDKKPKFVAPIKSLIPVKEISYKVVIINSLMDVSAVSRELELIDEDECVITLVYSNGFNQLNSQHTDDTCSPEGMMLCLQDTFFYIEDFVDGITKALGRILSSSTLISFDAKSILVYLASQYNYVPENLKIVDAKIGCSLINPDEPPECFSEAQKLLGHSAEYTVATECALQKAAWYMTLLRECSTKLKNILLDRSLWTVFTDIEMKIVPVIAGMEHHGISVDETQLKRMEDLLLTRMQRTERRCHAAAGRQFNVNSAAQVRALLYDELRLDSAANLKIRETIGKGAKSTSEAMLRPLIDAHPLPRLILEYRHLHKAHATFLAGIAQHVRDHVVKPTWEQSAAATGRIASNNPNVQAIPKTPFNLELFPDRDHADAAPPAVRFRSVYVARAGCALLAADFRHVECRVFARAAGDAALQAALAGADLFRELAARWRGEPPAAVSAQDRERTKRLVYASLYGAGTRKLAEILQLDYDQVLSIVSSFNRTFPALKSFGRAVVARCAAQAGRLATAAGRARSFADIASADSARRAHAERQAVNFVVQGTAADLCKMAMIRCSEVLRREGVEARLLLQIHDELVWEVPLPLLHTAAVLIKRAMESCGQAWGLPALPVALYRGHNWGEMEDFPLH
ncbi:DNA polymerase I [Bicyclus anynana]|uniref:DNA polymerase I n=1 Tax=Bicyclus anynana TaxID=110368 RepID=A0ABM3LM40_BICAN|nr:DNA polymerase I [Bicyclus anynana]